MWEDCHHLDTQGALPLVSTTMTINNNDNNNNNNNNNNHLDTQGALPLAVCVHSGTETWSARPDTVDHIALLCI